eukprot:3666756-Pyramimonas_sp.AAC.1
MLRYTEHFAGILTEWPREASGTSCRHFCLMLQHLRARRLRALRVYVVVPRSLRRQEGFPEWTGTP